VPRVLAVLQLVGLVLVRMHCWKREILLLLLLLLLILVHRGLCSGADLC
jgi:hypothetical protein